MQPNIDQKVLALLTGSGGFRKYSLGLRFRVQRDLGSIVITLSV